MKTLSSLAMALLLCTGCEQTNADPATAAPAISASAAPSGSSATRPHPHDLALELVAPFLPPKPMILEGGAFDGKDSVRMAELWPEAHIYSFEPVPKLFEKVKNAVKRHPGVTVYDQALADSNGTATFHISEWATAPGEPSASGSLRNPKEHTKSWPQIEFKTDIEVTTTTMDSWAEKNEIDRIDFLWLDIQGVELEVMKGSPRIMGTVRAIVAEVEFVELYEGQALYREMRTWLEEQGFRMVDTGFDFEKPPKGSTYANAIFVHDERAAIKPKPKE